jgi:hypothetical protein
MADRLAVKLLATIFTSALFVSGCAVTRSLDLSGMSFSETPLVGKVVWYDLITEDISSARRFYGELFGWTFEGTQGPGGGDYTVARSGNVYVAGMVSVPSGSGSRTLSRWLPYVSVADVDAALARSVRGGAEVAVGARNVALGRVAAIVDPEGAVVGLARSSVGDPDDRTTAPGRGRPVWTELLSRAPVQAASFYEQVAGYDARTIERRGGEYTLLSNGRADRAGILAMPAEDWDPVWLTYFGVDDPAATAARAEALGGRVLVPVSSELRDGSMAVLEDPSGAILVVQKLNR